MMILMAGRSASITASPRVKAALAQLLLSREVGQRIPTVQELQSIVRSGAGTVVKALRSLESDGAVGLEARGHQGTVVIARQVGKLWHAGELGNLHLAMPPPGPVEQLGLVRGFQEALDKIGVSVMVDFIGGARKRLEEVYHERAHTAITSSGAFGHHCDDLPGLSGLDLGESTYYGEGSLVVIERAGDQLTGRVRVGIDHGSHDHERLTEQEFAEWNATYVECPFVRAPEWVLAGRIDTAVWHEMPTVIPPELAGLRLRPLTSPGSKALLEQVSHASIVTRTLDAPTNAVMRTVRRADITRLQSELSELARRDITSSSVLWPR
jgi:hypothetical protein